MDDPRSADASSDQPQDETEDDIPENDDVEDEMYDEGWAWLPDILLEEIFAMLTHRQRYYCSMVCRHWYQVVKSPRV
jgi:hypothetical protein